MPEPTRGGRGSVLLVEDNVLNQLVAAGILGKLGYDAEVVDNGRDAVEAVAGGAYAAVLMDCRLPGLDGYQATAEVRRREGAARHTPIIAMTASATPEERDRCLAAGMDDYLTKPVLVTDLRAVLARWLPERPPAPGAAGGAAEALDRDRLAALMELDEDGQGSRLLTRLAAAFLIGAPADLAGLRAAVERGDAVAVGNVAHHLRGAAATLGGGAVVGLCEDLEVLAGADALASAGDLLGRLERELDRVRDALAAVVPER
jgi:CheY-like chemotaxis protein/HPt (histidine-containing phosphotransfer) domain-containing protein